MPVTWSAPALLETSSAGDAFEADIAMNGSGDAAVVWTQSDGTKRHLYARSFSASTSSWGTTVKMQSEVGDAKPRVVLNRQGKSMVVWSKDGASVWAASVPPEREAAAVHMIVSGSNTEPRVAMDDRGHAIAVWVDPTSGSRTLRSSRYNAFTDAWSELIDMATTPDPRSDVAMAPDGSALLVWPGYDGTSRYDILSKRFK